MIIRNRFEFINGGRIIAQHHTPGGRGLRPGRYIIVDKEHNTGRYVVAWQGVEGDGAWAGSWSNGDYCSSLEEANKAFTEKLRHGPCSPGVYHGGEYFCQDCDPQGLDAAYVLVSAGQSCSRCKGVVDNKGKWRERDAIDAMKDAVRQ